MKSRISTLMFIATLLLVAGPASADEYTDTIAVFKNAGESAAFFNNSPAQIDTTPLVPQEPAYGRSTDPLAAATEAATQAAVQREAAEAAYTARVHTPLSGSREATVDR